MIPTHGGQLRPLAERFGVPVEELLDLSANINPEGPPPAVLARLRADLDDPAVLTDYPDLALHGLRQAIAQYAGVPATHIVAANGFVPLLEAALRTLPIRRCALPVPAFNEYRKALARAGVDTMPHPLAAENHFGYIFEDVPAADALLLANPQNPTGVLHDRARVAALVEHAAQKGTTVLLDEAFIDYTPEQSLTPLVDRYRNLVVFRSVTKFHGIPGLRVAYLTAHPELAAAIADSLPPWPITTLAANAVCAALSDEAYAIRTRSLNLRRREDLAARLHTLGIATYPASANYLLLRFPPQVDTTDLWRRLIAEHHIVLRDCANYEALAPGHLRAAVRTEAESARLLEALRRLLR